MKSIDLLLTELSFEIVSLRGLSPNTAMAYIRDIRFFHTFLEDVRDKGINECQKDDLLAYFASLKSQLSSRTIARKTASLRFFFRFLHEKRYFENQLSLFCVSPKIPKTLPSHLSLSQVKTLFAYLYQLSESPKFTDKRNALLIMLLYVTGMRVSEALHIKIKDISQETIKIIGKGSKERLIPLPDYFSALLHSFLQLLPEDQTYLFQKSHKKITTFKMTSAFNKTRSNPRSGLFDLQQKQKPLKGNVGFVLTRGFVFKLLKTIMRHIFPHLSFSPHSLRHSIATHLLNDGMDLRHLQSFLGHQRVSTVAFYTHLDIKRLQKGYGQFHPRSKDEKKE